MNKPQLSPAERLKKGAIFLSQLWKVPEQRCTAGWSLDVCTCVPLKKFCSARLLWITLAVEECRDLEEGPYGLALAMTASEWDATGLTMKIEHSEVGVISIGSPQECVTGMVDIGKMMDAPEVLASTLRVLKAFPKSKVVGLEDIPAESVIELIASRLALPAEIANPDEAFE